MRDIKPPLGDSTVHLGRCTNSGQIAAVVWWRNATAPGDYDLVAVAVSVDFRGRRPSVGDLAMEHALNAMESEAADAGAAEMTVLGLCMAENRASRLLLERHGFRLADVGETPEPWMLVRQLGQTAHQTHGE